MDRTYWVEANDLLPGEKVVAQQATVRLYDGEDKVQKMALFYLMPTYELCCSDNV